VDAARERRESDAVARAHGRGGVGHGDDGVSARRRRGARATQSLERPSRRSRRARGARATQSFERPSWRRLSGETAREGRSSSVPLGGVSLFGRGARERRSRALRGEVSLSRYLSGRVSRERRQVSLEDCRFGSSELTHCHSSTSSRWK